MIESNLHPPVPIGPDTTGGREECCYGIHHCRGCWPLVRSHFLNAVLLSDSLPFCQWLLLTATTTASLTSTPITAFAAALVWCQQQEEIVGELQDMCAVRQEAIKELSDFLVPLVQQVHPKSERSVSCILNVLKECSVQEMILSVDCAQQPK